MNALVIGGSGFLGSHLCDALVGAGHRVTVVSRSGGSLPHVADLRGRITLVHATLDTLPATDAAWQGIDTVFHLACSTRPKSSNDDPAQDLADNVVATVRMLDRCVREGVRRVIFTSSGGTVYGNPQQVPIAEDHPTDPLCSYGIHKLAIEKYLHLYQVLHGLDYRIARVANAYGERQAVRGDQGLVAAVIGRLLSRQPVTIWGDGSVVRDYLHARDIADALLTLAQAGEVSRVFNVGSGCGLTVLEVVKAVEQALHCTAEFSWLPARDLDVPSNVLDIGRITRELGWTPRIDLAQGITRAVQWVQRHV